MQKRKRESIGKIPNKILGYLVAVAFLTVLATGFSTGRFDLVVGRFFVYIGIVVGIAALYYFGINWLNGGHVDPSWRGLPQLAIVTYLLWSMLRIFWAVLPFGNSDSFLGATYKVFVQVGKGGDNISAVVIFSVLSLVWNIVEGDPYDLHARMRYDRASRIFY